MKALYFTEHGGPEVMRYGELPDLTPGPGQALVQVKAVALNHVDLWVRRGGPAFDKLPKPHVGGADVAGIVAGYGEGAAGPRRGHAGRGRSRRGDRARTSGRGGARTASARSTTSSARTGGAAAPSMLVVPAVNLLPMPDDFDFAEAAAPLLVYLTAWRMLVTRAQLKAGETVAIVGAGGGVNSAAIQICQAPGRDGLCDHLDAGEDGAGDGARRGSVDQLQGGGLVEGRVPGDGRNVGSTWWSTTSARRPGRRASARWPAGGRLVNVGGTGGPVVEMDLRLVFRKQISILGSTMGSHQDFRDVMDLIWQRKLTPVVDRVLPLSEGRAAHEYLENGEQFGKVVLTP